MIPWPKRASHLPFKMFQTERSNAEARAAQKLENIYHMGQQKAWVGTTVLNEIIAKLRENVVIRPVARFELGGG